jgi:hypothetical protein
LNFIKVRDDLLLEEIHLDTSGPATALMAIYSKNMPPAPLSPPHPSGKKNDSSPSNGNDNRNNQNKNNNYRNDGNGGKNDNNNENHGCNNYSNTTAASNGATTGNMIAKLNSTDPLYTLRLPTSTTSNYSSPCVMYFVAAPRILAT